MPTAFERLILGIPELSSVMDVGYGGLDGENTTDYLRARFGLIQGLCKDVEAVERYQVRHSAQDYVIIGMYPSAMPSEKFDLLVLDPNIDTNLDFWSEEGMAKALSYVNGGGHIITYILTTDEYGDEHTQERLRQHRKEWWGVPRDLGIVSSLVEERRPEITWVLIKKP